LYDPAVFALLRFSAAAAAAIEMASPKQNGKSVDDENKAYNNYPRELTSRIQLGICRNDKDVVSGIDHGEPPVNTNTALADFGDKMRYAKQIPLCIMAIRF
jgi:hypothetical protein